MGTDVDISDLGNEWKEAMTKGGQHVLQETYVKATDAHFDAMLFPHLHVHGTGSLHSEPGPQHARLPYYAWRLPFLPYCTKCDSVEEPAALTVYQGSAAIACFPYSRHSEGG